MRNFLTALLCLSLTGIAAAQNSGSSTTSSQHAATEASAQPKSKKNSKQPTAIFETTAGNITCTLLPEQSPITVANFIGLATGTKDWTDPKTGKVMHGVPLYNGTIFHRVIPDFMIQGGDPMATGIGGPGYKFRDEATSLTFDRPGRLAMANSGPNTNGSQFFITEAPYPSLNGHYNLFGQCEDIDVVKKIARMPTDRNDRPRDPVKIIQVKIIDPHHPAKEAGTAAPDQK